MHYFSHQHVNASKTHVASTIAAAGTKARSSVQSARTYIGSPVFFLSFVNPIICGIPKGFALVHELGKAERNIFSSLRQELSQNKQLGTMLRPTHVCIELSIAQLPVQIELE